MPTEQYEVHWKDYYQLLGVRSDSDAETIQRMWRRLSRVYHPDVAGDTNVDPQRMHELNEAYEVLSDPERRARYDRLYRSGDTNGNAPPEASTQQSDSQEQASWEERSAPESRAPTYQKEESDAWASELSSRFPPFRFLENLAENLSPNPDEEQRIFSSPSWRWQRLALLGSPPMAILICISALASAAWVFLMLAIVWLAGAFYAGVATDWLRDARDAPAPARIVGGASIIVSGTSYAIAILSIIIYGAIMLFFFRIGAALLKDWWEREKAK